VAGIVRDGLVPNAGESPHRTKTRTSVFLAGDAEGALIYADAHCHYRWPTGVLRRCSTAQEPVLIRVNTSGLDLEVDKDDLSDEVDSYLEAIAEESGVTIETLWNGPLSPTQVNAVEQVIEDLQDEYEGVGVYGEIESRDGEEYLVIVPVHVLSVADEAAWHHDLTVDDYRFMQSVDDRFGFVTTQYQFAGPISLDRITGIYLLARRARPDLVLESFGGVTRRRPGADPEWRVRRFRRLTGPQARKLVGRR
jgi:hypothetical protein